LARLRLRFWCVASNRRSQRSNMPRAVTRRVKWCNGAVESLLTRIPPAGQYAVVGGQEWLNKPLPFVAARRLD
jgi:hypothetical protein